MHRTEYCTVYPDLLDGRLDSYLHCALSLLVISLFLFTYSSFVSDPLFFILDPLHLHLFFSLLGSSASYNKFLQITYFIDA